MSYIVLFHWQPFKAIIYFSVWFLIRIWLFFIPLSSHQSHREDFAFLNSWIWFSNSSFSHGILNNEHKYEHKYQQIKLHSVFKMFLCLFWWIWGNNSQQFIKYIVTILRQVVIRQLRQIVLYPALAGSFSVATSRQSVTLNKMWWNLQSRIAFFETNSLGTVYAHSAFINFLSE